jgi:hypothetical protein
MISRRADAVTQGPDDKLYFVEPHIEQMTMQDLLTKLADKGKSSQRVDIGCMRVTFLNRSLIGYPLSAVTERQSILTRVLQPR